MVKESVEHPILDPWADARLAEERRLLAELEIKAKAEESKRSLRAQRWDLIWQGVGIAGIILVVAALLFMAGLGFYNSSKGDKTRDIEVERYRAAQIESCIKLQQPLERQYCLLTVNTPGTTPAKAGR